MTPDRDTICAPATAPGGALAVVRVSGGEALAVTDRIFRGTKPLAQARGYTVHYGRIADGGQTVDDVLVTVFRAPHSYTGEDAVEISCHGSSFVVSEILRLLLAAGARMAAPGEFTLRAYLAGKMDLSQAEAVGDLIASSSRAAHALAANQMRGGYSSALDALRERLLHLASLLELELDFSEEEVEFADRTQLRDTMTEIAGRIDALRRSFSLGNAIREGVAVAIVGAPNVGKSTLLNRLVDDERAMVSDIAGTTRDVIEERANIDGVLFRFLDTAGIRRTDDRLERMGIERTLQSISRARIVLRLLDASALPSDGTLPAPDFTLTDDQTLLTVLNKIDTAPTLRLPDATPDPGLSAPAASSAASPLPAPGSTLREDRIYDIHLPDTAVHLPDDTAPAPDSTPREDRTPGFRLPDGCISISAKRGDGIDRLRAALRASVPTDMLYHGDAVVSHARHLEALTEARDALRRALDGLDTGLSTDLLSEEIRTVITHLGTITGRGAIASDEILASIFSHFCIGK